MEIYKDCLNLVERQKKESEEKRKRRKKKEKKKKKDKKKKYSALDNAEILPSGTTLLLGSYVNRKEVRGVVCIKTSTPATSCTGTKVFINCYTRSRNVFAPRISP